METQKGQLTFWEGKGASMLDMLIISNLNTCHINFAVITYHYKVVFFNPFFKS